MNKAILWLSGAIVAFSLAKTPMTYAGHHRERGNHPPVPHAKCMKGMTMTKIAEKLDLTTDQRNKLHDMHMQIRDNMKEKGNQLFQIHKKMDELFKNETVDESKLTLLVNQEKEVVNSVLQANVMVRLELHNLLTPEQRNKFVQMLTECMQNQSPAHPPMM